MSDKPWSHGKMPASGNKKYLPWDAHEAPGFGLKKCPKNYCFKCEREIGIDQRGNYNLLFWKPRTGKKAFVGYSHNFDCLGEDIPPADENTVVRR
ncbi:hypothetical protein [Xenococcus sp. PCC 7305]|uniref:hypothetical protein n=1 Tax=Xenococcus sp. PCC 7305 TaxID=102125 RepID=UPI000592D744|nr:hypothetical protein [Xenococcus sp. PCC 7305]